LSLDVQHLHNFTNLCKQKFQSVLIQTIVTTF